MPEQSPDTLILRPTPTNLAAELTGRVLADRYALKRPVGQGGFGIVFEAEDRRLGRRVAAKVLSANAASNPDALIRFETEAKAAAQIGHEGIVDVRDFGSDDGTHFIIMEFIDGVDLAQVIRREGPLPLARCLLIASRVAQALAAAHDHGIIHRDLKPANILLTRIGGLDDFAKVLDFGISKITELVDTSTTPLTETGTVVGTPRYMAPEQAIGALRIDGRADIYALGIILYEMATRDVPFAGSTPYETLHLKASFEPRAPSEINPTLGLPHEFDALMARALERDLERRFASMWQFDAAIRALLKALDPAAAALVEPSRSKPRSVDPGDPAQPTAPTRAMSQAPRKPAIATPMSRRARRRLGLVALGVAVVALSATTAWIIKRADRMTEPPAGKPHPAPTAPIAVPVTPDVGATDEFVELDLDIEPATATVEVDGSVRTDNPLRLKREARTHELTVAAPGFVPHKRSISASANERIVIKLEPVRRPPTKTDRQRFPDTPIEPR